MNLSKGPTTKAATITQKIRTAHLDLRPADNQASLPAPDLRLSLIEDLPADHCRGIFRDPALAAGPNVVNLI